MKILPLLLAATCVLSLGACAGAPKKSEACCSSSSAKTKCCPAGDVHGTHGKVKPKAS